VTASEWSFPRDLNPAAMTFGSDWLAPLREGISGIPRGLGDYSIGAARKREACLWFWW
jgi:hypothetical protein